MAKEAKKEKKPIQKEYTVGLQPVYNFPKPSRTRKALTHLKRFIFKHLRIKAENVLISNKVNEYIWQNGREHIPRKIEIKVIVAKGKANIFLKGEKAKVPKEEKKKEKRREKDCGKIC